MLLIKSIRVFHLSIQVPTQSAVLSDWRTSKEKKAGGGDGPHGPQGRYGLFMIE